MFICLYASAFIPQPRAEEKIQVFYRNLDDKSKVLEVSATENVSIVKERILEKEKIKTSADFFYLCCGKVLMDDRLLSDYDIRKHCTIYLLGRLR